VTRPTALPVLADQVPSALREQHRWLTWRYVWQQRDSGKGRWTKRPAGKSNDPSTWSTFDTAITAHRDTHADGIGFCLGDGWAGIDLDHLTAGPIIDRLPCYRERSPSGHGTKAIGRSSRIGGEINFAAPRPAHTPWFSARFFAITGHGEGDPTVDITDLLDEWFPHRQSTAARDLPSYLTVGDTRGTENIETLTDDQVLTRAATAINRDKFLRLFRGDASGYGGDLSRADQALVSILLFWCGGDHEQTDRLFRQSALMRDKWNTRSYRLATLNRAAILLREAVV
jgi:putative DNA primase/helicase